MKNSLNMIAGMSSRALTSTANMMEKSSTVMSSAMEKSTTAVTSAAKMVERSTAAVVTNAAKKVEENSVKVTSAVTSSMREKLDTLEIGQNFNLRQSKSPNASRKDSQPLASPNSSAAGGQAKLSKSNNPGSFQNFNSIDDEEEEEVVDIFQKPSGNNNNKMATNSSKKGFSFDDMDSSPTATDRKNFDNTFDPFAPASTPAPSSSTTSTKESSVRSPTAHADSSSTLPRSSSARDVKSGTESLQIKTQSTAKNNQPQEKQMQQHKQQAEENFVPVKNSKSENSASSKSSSGPEKGPIASSSPKRGSVQAKGQENKQQHQGLLSADDEDPPSPLTKWQHTALNALTFVYYAAIVNFSLITIPIAAGDISSRFPRIYLAVLIPVLPIAKLAGEAVCVYSAGCKSGMGPHRRYILNLSLITFGGMLGAWAAHANQWTVSYIFWLALTAVCVSSLGSIAALLVEKHVSKEDAPRQEKFQQWLPFASTIFALFLQLVGILDAKSSYIAYGIFLIVGAAFTLYVTKEKQITTSIPKPTPKQLFRSSIPALRKEAKHAKSFMYAWFLHILFGATGTAVPFLMFFIAQWSNPAPHAAGATLVGLFSSILASRVAVSQREHVPEQSAIEIGCGGVALSFFTLHSVHHVNSVYVLAVLLGASIGLITSTGGAIAELVVKLLQKLPEVTESSSSRQAETGQTLAQEVKSRLQFDLGVGVALGPMLIATSLSMTASGSFGVLTAVMVLAGIVGVMAVRRLYKLDSTEGNTNSTAATSSVPTSALGKVTNMISSIV